jgi:PAS domain S-box-containing protein
MPAAISWIVVAWTAMAAASLTLACIHLVVWLRRRTEYGHLLFSALALSAAAFGWFELSLMRASTPAAYAEMLKWAQVPLTAVVLSIVGFVHFYLGTGRAWLAVATCAVRLFGLALDFTTGVNVNFREVISLDRLVLWSGETVATPVGIANPWTIVPQLANLMLLVFVVDAAVELWRRGDAVSRRRAVLVGGSLALCIAFAAATATLILTGTVRAPPLVTPSVFLVVVAMGYELVSGVLAAAQLAADLRAKEERFRAVVETVPSAILLVDRAGTIRFANARVEAVFAHQPGELVGRNVDMLVPPRLAPRHAEHRRAFMDAPRARAMGAGRELQGRRKDGSEVPVEVALSPLAAAEEPLVLVSVVDVSERRRNEREVADQRNELAHLSRVATLGALSGSLAHELNQPLAAILSNAQAAQRFLAMREPRLDQVAEILADIVKSDRRAAAVIQRLRALLKRDDAQHEALDVNDLVQDVLRLMHSDLLNRRVEATVDLAARLPHVVADRVQLQQVLVNFVMNGCEAMEDVAGPRRLLVRSLANGAGNVEIAVSDGGHGIPQADLERVFEPFVTTKRQGIGLGLAICRSIIDAHRGRIWATNNPAGGATLHLELPPPPPATTERDAVADRIRG